MADLTVTNADLWNALVSGKPDVPGPLAELVALDTPLPASNLLRRSLRLAQAAFTDLDADRVKLVERYVARDEAGEKIAEDGGFRITDAAAFQREFDTLMQVEVTLAGAQAVSVAALGDIKFSGQKLELLSKFVTD